VHTGRYLIYSPPLRKSNVEWQIHMTSSRSGHGHCAFHFTRLYSKQMTSHFTSTMRRHSLCHGILIIGSICAPIQPLFTALGALRSTHCGLWMYPRYGRYLSRFGVSNESITTWLHLPHLTLCDEETRGLDCAKKGHLFGKKLTIYGPFDASEIQTQQPCGL
jgi:hypothetical protein